MKHSKSDYYWFLKLNSAEKNEMTPLEVYKGCIFMAINGQRHEFESNLNSLYQDLLDVRRLTYFGSLEQSFKQIKKVRLFVVLWDGAILRILKL